MRSSGYNLVHMSAIHKKDLEHLARLSRIELDPKKEEKLLADLGNILDHFEELKALDTTHVTPLTGGTELTGAFREDEAHVNTDQKKGTENFPEAKNGFLVIPPVFE